MIPSIKPFEDGISFEDGVLVLVEALTLQLSVISEESDITDILDLQKVFAYNFVTFMWNANLQKSEMWGDKKLVKIDSHIHQHKLWGRA